MRVVGIVAKRGSLQAEALARQRACYRFPKHSPQRARHGIVEQVISDCLAVAERRDIELSCDWPPSGIEPFPLAGDDQLLTVLLRNLLDNAVRYAPSGTLVTLRFFEDRLEVIETGRRRRWTEEAKRRIVEESHAPGATALAVERAQEIIYLLYLLKEEGRLPKIPIYLDSPMGVRSTNVYDEYPTWQNLPKIWQRLYQVLIVKHRMSKYL